MSDLIKRVESATGPDRELDCVIHVTLFKWKLSRVAPDIDGQNASEVYTENGKMIDGFVYPPKGKISPYYHVPNDLYTSSLDAAVSLCERVLPGWGWSVGEPLGKVGNWASVWRNGLNISDDGQVWRAVDGRAGLQPDTATGAGSVRKNYSPTPALALVLAILRAHPDGGSDA